MSHRHYVHVLPVVLLLLLSACNQDTVVDYSGPIAGWTEPTGAKGGGQFSPLTQIDKNNVSHLQVAWTYSSPDFSTETKDLTGAAAKGGSPHGASSNVEVTPIVVDDKMVLCTPLHRVVAIDPITGKELWNYDPHMDQRIAGHICRGVVNWQEPQIDQSKPCQQRIFSSTGDGRLIALDLKTGLLCKNFGQDGVVDMKYGLGPMQSQDYYNTAPPLVINDLVLVGHAVRDGFRNNIAGGVIRAWNVRTGQLVWAWDPVGPGMQPVTAQEAEAGKTYTRGTPNVWSFMSADVENGLVFLPTGNAPADHFKGPERAIDHYGSAVVALDAGTGKVVWSFQTVHHDLWDYDVAAQPILYEAEGKVPALALTTKEGHIFLLNRLNGKPLFPVEERPVPQTDVPGEWSSPTQPFPTLPKPLFDRRLSDDDLIGYPIASKGCKKNFDALRNEGIFTPPSLKGSMQFPGISGGFNWGSGSINPQKGILVAVYLNMPLSVKLIPRTDNKTADGDDSPFNFMDSPQYETPYSFHRVPLMSDYGVPCVKPPWGSMIAIDLKTGLELWHEPLGSMKSRIPLIGSWFNIGVPLIGGNLQTASGLAFVGASADETLRAFDVETGKMLWSTSLPLSAHSTPMTYRLSKNGKQYLVVATGGISGFDAKIGNTLVAYTLPD